MSTLVEQMMQIREWIGVARAETAIMKQLCGNDVASFSRVALKWMDISESLVDFIINNTRENFHRLRCDLADVMCILPRNTCEAVAERDNNKQLSSQISEVRKSEYVDPIKARKQYLRMMSKSQRMRRIVVEKQANRERKS